MVPSEPRLPIAEHSGEQVPRTSRIHRPDEHVKLTQSSCLLRLIAPGKSLLNDAWDRPRRAASYSAAITETAIRRA
jgi:hypothetical protein